MSLIRLALKRLGIGWQRAKDWIISPDLEYAKKKKRLDALIALAQRCGWESGVRIIPCWLPTKSPWLNGIEPKWVHGKRAIVEPARLLTAQELRQRVFDYFGCELAELLTQRVS